MSLTFQLLQYFTITYVETVSTINSYAVHVMGGGSSLKAFDRNQNVRSYQAPVK
jgi:hypothetical protein